MYIFINRDLEIRLSEDSSQYKQFWKQICKFGEYVNPNGNGKMILDKKFADEMVGNFKSGKYGVVPVPLGHPKDSIELAELNRGEVGRLVAALRVGFNCGEFAIFKPIELDIFGFTCLNLNFE